MRAKPPVFAILSCTLCCAAAALLAQNYGTGPRDLTFHSTVDDSDQPYAIYVPRMYDPAKKYPLVIGLHAEEMNHNVNLVQMFGVLGTPGDIGLMVGRGFPRLPDVDFIIACPFSRGTMGYQGIAEKDVYDLLAEVEKKYSVDEDRVYLTGISMGGGGALRLALTRPDIWAAVAPLCASPVPEVEELAPNALDLPIRLFHGELDPAMPASLSRDWQKRLLDAGDPAEYIEYPGMRHNAWDAAYRNRAIFEWFATHRRNPVPERVRLVTRTYGYGSAYWIRIDAMTPGTLASIYARLVNKTEARVETHDLDGFSIRGQVLTLPAVVTVDNTAIRVRAGSELSFSKENGRWRLGRATAGAKAAGSEGPIAAAVSDRHIYVYGSADNPSARELEQRRAVAARAAEWSSPPYARLNLRFAVKADTEVTAADLEDADVVLFGTRETNSLMARLRRHLPLALNPGAADYGLLFIAPLGKHYALVSSGLPWWTGADEAKRGGDMLRAAAFSLLTTFGDYHSFQGLAGPCGVGGPF